MKKLKKLKNRLGHSRVSFRSVLLVVAVLAIAQLVFDAWIYHTHQVDHAAVQSSQADRLVMMLTSAIKDVNKPAVIDPTSKRVYLPDANIVLPPSADHAIEIRYAYTGGDGNQQSMRVTTSDAVQSGIAKVLGAQPSDDMAAVFSQVPNAQACSRGLLVTLGSSAQKQEDATLASSKKLHDGRTMRVYQQDTCSGYDFAPLIAYLKDARSY